MDSTFLSTNQKEVVLEFVEVKAHASSKTVKESLLLVFDKLLVLIDH